MNPPIEPMPSDGERAKKKKTSKVLIVPLAAAILSAYFDYRLKAEKQRTEAGYSAVAPAMTEIQKQVTTLGNQVQLLQQLMLVMSQERGAEARRDWRHGSGTGRPQPPAPITEVRADESPALANFKHDLVVKVTKSQGRPAMQRQIPNRLDDVPAAK